MAGELAVKGLDFIADWTFKIALEIDDRILKGVAVAACATAAIGAFYLRHRRESEKAIRNSLEKNENGEGDLQVIKIEKGSIRVELCCHTQKSFLQFVKDFEEKKVKRRLEEEFKKIGFDKELEVTIVNAQEVFQRKHEIR